MFHRKPRTTTTRTSKPTLMTRLRGPNARQKTVKTTTTTTSHPTARTHHGVGHNAGYAPHHHRKPSIGDKVSGAIMKLKGSLTRRPGVKAAGTRRMHGTDGRGSHRYHVY
ncbi:hypothetical protein N7492_009881 [Penicillium capsulatum]|uniref:Uncharacterized protein n=1 Tax=Penicillium capsulatum TaxID=69766 RepID=A0A9W9HLE1_9EURO|nr:hypothetical protein N7492_009881 [Penicillium capsulatum]KAJ6112392.1 hypothetical protein N7512_007716 [Penicillium capsulatum]